MKTNVQLQQDVIHELLFDPILSSSSTEIGVIAKEGIITLSGRVDSYAKKLAAEKAAKRVKGVHVVALDIEVVLPGTHTHTDTDLALAINQALKWHSAVEEDLIKVKVEEGWVYLDGEVKWSYQKKVAEKAVENLLGIKGVINRLTVKPTGAVDTKKLKSDINAAFHRSATIDSGNIWLEVAGHRVVLHGQVRSFAEKKEAEKCAWKAAGVTEVENRIEVRLDTLV